MPEKVRYGKFVLNTGVAWDELDVLALDRLQAARGTHDAQDVEYAILQLALGWVREDQVRTTRFDTLPVDPLPLDASASSQVDLGAFLAEGRARNQGCQARSVMGLQSKFEHLYAGTAKVSSWEDSKLSRLFFQALEAGSPELGIQKQIPRGIPRKTHDGG